MLPRRANDPQLPSAWRGVASPRFAAWARWQALAEAMGGRAAHASGTLIPLCDILAGRLGEAGQVEMSLLTGSAEKAELEAYLYAAAKVLLGAKGRQPLEDAARSLELHVLADHLDQVAGCAHRLDELPKP